ncbi:MAG: FkbM family methyltransferase [Candidatus Bathyarchaeia archaeon]
MAASIRRGVRRRSSLLQQALRVEGWGRIHSVASTLPQLFPGRVRERCRRLDTLLSLISRGLWRPATVRCDGSRFRVADPESLWILSPGYEIWMDGLLSKLRDGDTFLDVGAHVGRYTVRVAKRGFRVVAVEANPQTYPLLTENVKLNGVADRVVCLHQAAWNREGWLRFYSSKVRGWSTCLRRYAAEVDGVYRVRGRPLDHSLEELGLVREVGLAKVDVEGAEVEALEGLRRTIAASHPRLIVEVKPPNASRFSNFIRSIGYTAHPIPEDQTKGNFLCEPRGGEG